MADLSIREILEQVGRGQIRIPAFQRGFVWEPERVAYLMDSIYKRYPFGSLLFWRTKEALKFDRKLGPFELPEPEADYPIDYVLDGQQRITSIFGVFQTALEITDPTNWLPIYFDLDAEPVAQDSQFVALAPEEVDDTRHFPLSSLFDTVTYRKATEGFDDEVIKKIDRMQEVFKETKIPVQLSTTEDKATVAIIFEQVNRQGVELDTLQLLSAWTWSDEFQLQDQFRELADELGPFGFHEVGSDTNLLLRCCSAILQNDASPQALMGMNGADVRNDFEKVVNGVKYAVDYLRSHFNVEKLSNLPFSTLIVPLSAFFAVAGNKQRAVKDDQRLLINRWFWRSCFSRRYSSGVLRNLNSDIEEMVKLRDGHKSALGEFNVDLDASFFLSNKFGLNNVNTKTFILLLAKQTPLSFLSGAAVDLAATLKEANRAEFHHLMPKAFLKATKQQDPDENVLANFCFLSRADNQEVGGVAPSEYQKKMPQNMGPILKSAVTSNTLFSDNFKKFTAERSQLLSEIAMALCDIPNDGK